MSYCLPKQTKSTPVGSEAEPVAAAKVEIMILPASFDDATRTIICAEPPPR
jgi:hypothetical protein